MDKMQALSILVFEKCKRLKNTLTLSRLHLTDVPRPL
jgi:hypothetical protein